MEIQVATDFPIRADMNKKYDTFAITDSYSRFNLDSKAVQIQIAAVNQIPFGKAGNAKTAVENYRSKLKTAGIDKIITELKKQLENYKEVK